MMNLSQHGNFDQSLEASIREELLTEFGENSSWADRCGEWTAEDFGEIPDGFDFAACQRPNGTVYPIADGKKCRQGVPISIGPNDKHRDIMKKAQAAGLKVRSILEENDKLRAEKGVRMVRGEKMVKSLARRLNERIDRKQQPAIKQATKKPEPPKESTKKTESAILRKIEGVIKAPGKLDKEEIKRLGQELKKARAQRALEDQTPKRPSKSKPVPYGLDKDAQIIVNKKLLGQDTSILQRILEERSLNPRQRAKIEEEVAGRGETPAQAKRINRREAAAAGKEGKGWNFVKGVEGYDPIQAFARQDNELLAEGAMGKAFRTKGPPPGVVKKGQIGEFEADAWQKLQGTGRVPEFHGAATSQRLRDVEQGLGGHVKEGKGYLGIGEAKGRPVASLGITKPEERRDLVNEYIRARRDIHLAGVAHNDMHGGNVFYDRATKRMQVIDFGLAQVSHKAALVEALSTNNGDWQSAMFLSRWKPSGDEPEAYVQFRKNQRAIIRILEERGYEPNQLGIRMKSGKIDEVLEEISEADARSYLKVLYKNV